jgi:hypothetical protein
MRPEDQIQHTKYVLTADGLEAEEAGALSTRLVNALGIAGDWEPATPIDLSAWGRFFRVELTLGEPAIASATGIALAGQPFGSPTPVSRLALVDDLGHQVELRLVQIH